MLIRDKSLKKEMQCIISPDHSSKQNTSSFICIQEDVFLYQYIWHTDFLFDLHKTCGGNNLGKELQQI